MVHITLARDVDDVYMYIKPWLYNKSALLKVLLSVTF